MAPIIETDASTLVKSGRKRRAVLLRLKEPQGSFFAYDALCGLSFDESLKTRVPSLVFVQIVLSGEIFVLGAEGTFTGCGEVISGEAARGRHRCIIPSGCGLTLVQQPFPCWTYHNER